MKKLSKDLKRMLAGLAYQDAGDFLSRSEKMKVLGNKSENRAKPATPGKVGLAAVTKRIAFISNGRGFGAPLDYAIDACVRQNAQIDLLLHGTADIKTYSALEKKIQDAGVTMQRIQIAVNAVDDIVEYINKHPSLIYLIAMPDDDVARLLIEEVLPRRRSRIQIPLVLIEDRMTATLAKQSAA